MSREAADTTTAILQSVVEGGTGTAARSAGRPAAGKTGTAEEDKAAWFAGYTPDLATVVAVLGQDPETGAHKPLYGALGLARINGGGYPARIWAQYTKAALKGSPGTSSSTAADRSPTPPKSPRPGRGRRGEAEEGDGEAAEEDRRGGGPGDRVARAKRGRAPGPEDRRNHAAPARPPGRPNNGGTADGGTTTEVPERPTAGRETGRDGEPRHHRWARGRSPRRPTNPRAPTEHEPDRREDPRRSRPASRPEKGCGTVAGVRGTAPWSPRTPRTGRPPRRADPARASDTYAVPRTSTSARSSGS